MGVKGINAVVTGGNGFTGRRLVEMLLERGCARIVSFDIAPKADDAVNDPKVVYMQGDITKPEDVDKACEGADCVWHVAALVGPFHPADLYTAVNYEGTMHVINSCKKYKVGRIIMSSSPSTRMDGSDIDGLTEEQLHFPKKYLQAYAESKAAGERALCAANSDELMTVAIAPHQLYGPRDPLFLPNFLEAARTGKLRIFGSGKYRISFTYIDNYCHALINGYDNLKKGSPVLGKFYIVTDGGYKVFWEQLDTAVQAMGYKSLWKKVHIPLWLLWSLAYICNVIGFFLRRKMKINPFTVRMLTMHRWFDISAAEKDLGYKPLVTPEQGWKITLDWHKENWLPKHTDKSKSS
ncbi:unnamed protein product [Chrysoparadoxa australica]